jgi:hypothetical protein
MSESPIKLPSVSENELVPVKVSRYPWQQKLWDWAAIHVVPWSELRTDDYDFRPWAKNASDELLNAGCFYEFARESHLYRCWLVLGTRHKPKELCGTISLIEFKGSSAAYQYLFESGWATWLDNFADQLISNKPFAELLRTSKSEVQKSLEAIPSYCLIPKAVELPRGHTKYPGLQIIEIQICWRYYTDTDIGKGMKELAKKLRPAQWPSPQRRGTGKATSIVAFLDGLSAMRLASYYPKSLRAGSIRKDRRKDRRGTVSAIDIFDDVRLGKIDGLLIHSDLEEYAGRSRRQFSRWFPFHKDPANGITWAMRQRRKQ